MRWASSLSRQDTAPAALEEAIAAARAQLGDAPAHLVLAFFSPHFLERAPALSRALRAAFPGARVAGLSATGLIGAGHEAEDVAGLSLAVAHLPGVALEALHVTEADSPRLRADTKAAVILADVFSWDAAALLDRLDASCPRAVKVGGCASGGEGPGEHALILDEHVYREGAVVLGLSGALEVQALVAQGCRPVGPRRRVTRADHNLLMEMDGQRTLDVLVAMHRAAPPEERARYKESLLVGLGGDCASIRGDLLARDIVGLEPICGAVAVGGLPEEGQAVQFMLRDARAAKEELAARLGEAAVSPTPPAGALLFSCVGRGRTLYGEDGHDARAFAERFPGVSLGGAFCSGEVAPLCGRTRVHGFTSVFALFRPGGDVA